MKKRIFISLLSMICLLIPITYAHALDIEGWWRANMTIEEGDFVTGAWFTTQAKMKKVSYLYIFDSHENTFQGIAYLILWNPGTGQYDIPPETYTVYQRNNIIVLAHSPLFDDSGNLIVGSTIVLRAHGTANVITSMQGFYTLYDIENVSTPEQFVRMGPVSASRVDVSLVPASVTALIP